MRRYWHFSWIKFVVWTSLFFHSTGKFEFFSRRSSTVINTINFKQYCKQFDKYFEWDQIITQNQFISERWNCWILRCRFVRCLLRIYKTLDRSQLQKIWELFQGNGWPNEVEIVLRKNCGRRPLWLRYGTGTRAVRNLLNHYFILFYLYLYFEQCCAFIYPRYIRSRDEETFYWTRMGWNYSRNWTRNHEFAGKHT